MVDIELLKRFHTHIGPFVILGYRIGEYARKEFPENSKIRCEIRIRTSPPVSCMIDGIQISTGCTLGRGLIKVIENDGHGVSINFFSSEKSVKIRLREEKTSRILKMLKENRINESVDFVMNSDIDELVVSDEKD
ncbi:MAG: formylmethanofuran dehydrogenase subunit E family protein [Candidatus Aenigmarchaeota archaeon]|nr:formylmethanofuran dehydrogenase subunit E family protein [Candidatus Aenigmarchaeota archaeon]